ncbi:hypothetical protein AAFC00_007133 [Neodothiora populina]|uniref:Azaphilone pigments biosynthesis cluster protein L N-terminal domain-containing protein n=1 Tax=Neodothiora populina TaxID=2781224 RepID=A0ABR3PH93_9PEZI
MDPASAFGIVASAAHSIHVLVGFINNIIDAPTAVQRVRDELRNVQAVLQSLEDALVRASETAAWTQLIEKSKLAAALKTMDSACKTFHSSLCKWTRSSMPGNKLSMRDSVNIAWHDKELALLATQLSSCKQTILLALGSCTLQAQYETMKTTDQINTALLTQEERSTGLLAELKTQLTGLVVREKDLRLDMDRSEDIEKITTLDDELRNVSRGRLALKQCENVSEYVSKISVATRTGQDIGDVTIDTLGYGAVGMSNVEQSSDVKQKIGNVNIGKQGTGFVGMHNNVDHSSRSRNGDAN